MGLPRKWLTRLAGCLNQKVSPMLGTKGGAGRCASFPAPLFDTSELGCVAFSHRGHAQELTNSYLALTISAEAQRQAEADGVEWRSTGPVDLAPFCQLLFGEGFPFDLNLPFPNKKMPLFPIATGHLRCGCRPMGVELVHPCRCTQYLDVWKD